MSPPRGIDTILFDADGVIQRRSADHPKRLATVAGSPHRAEAFLAEAFALEAECLTGCGDFQTALSELLTRWPSQSSLSDMLAVWSSIEVDAEIIALIQALRRGGITCCLATNQEPYRARHMSTVLGYSQVFDREFYSCDIGTAKPALAFFDRILRTVRVPPSRVLFLDDIQTNIDAASQVGINARYFEPHSGIRLITEILSDFHVLGASDQMT